MEKKRQLVYNALKCKNCGEVVISRYRHDFKKCSCKNVSLDGGLDHIHLGVGKFGAEDLSVYLDEPFEKVRQYFYRYNQEKHGYETLENISDEWLENIITWYLDIKPERRWTQIKDWALCLYIREKQYRNIDLEYLNAA